MSGLAKPRLPARSFNFASPAMWSSCVCVKKTCRNWSLFSSITAIAGSALHPVSNNAASRDTSSTTGRKWPAAFGPEPCG